MRMSHMTQAYVAVSVHGAPPPDVNDNTKDGQALDAAGGRAPR